MIGGGDASVTGWALELDLGGFGDEQGAVKRFDPGSEVKFLKSCE